MAQPDACALWQRNQQEGPNSAAMEGDSGLDQEKMMKLRSCHEHIERAGSMEKK